MRYRATKHFSRRQWQLGAAAVLVLALVMGLTVGLLGWGGDRLRQLVAESAADLSSWRGVSYQGVVIDADGVATAVALTVTREGAAYGTLTRDFGARAELAVDGSGILLKGNRQWWLWERPGAADTLADAWIANPPDDATGLVPLALLTPTSLSRQISTPEAGIWTEVGEQTVDGQRALVLGDGARQAVVTADTPHRLLSLGLPISFPAQPVPRAYIAQGGAQPQDGGQLQPTASFAITQPTETEDRNTRAAASAIKRSGLTPPQPLSQLIQALPNLDPQLLKRLALRGIDPTKAVIAGQYGQPLLAVLDELTRDVTAATAPGAQQKIEDATIVLSKAVRNDEFAALHQLVTSGKLWNPGDLRKFMGQISAIGQKRHLEEAARRTMDTTVNGRTIDGHEVVLDGKYTPPDSAQEYGADILDLTAREAIQVKTVTSGRRVQVGRSFIGAVGQMTGDKGEIPPPGFTRVVQLNLERAAADGMGMMDRELLLTKLQDLNLYEMCFIKGKCFVDRIDVTNFAATSPGKIRRYEFRPEEFKPPSDPAAGPPSQPQPRPQPGPPEAASPPPQPQTRPAPPEAASLFKLTGGVPASGALVDAASQPPVPTPGGIDFSSLELRYLADTNSGDNHSLQYAFTALPATGNQRPDIGLQTAQRASDAFFVWLTLPTSKFTVNLNPDEPNRIIDADLGRTDAGRILLEADLRLKKTVAQLIHPDTPRGAKFWEALEGQGAENCFSFRQWIVPAPAVVRENAGELYILDAPLLVKMETEYFQARGLGNGATACPLQQKSVEAHNEEVFRTMVLPLVQRAVNEAPEYAELRRVYLSRVAAEWYRDRSAHENTAFAGLINRGDITSWTSRQPWSPREVFNRYVESFTNGEFNVTRQTQHGAFIETKTYIFGGVDLTNIPFNNLTASNFQSKWPGLSNTVKQAFDHPIADQKGRTWLGSTSAVSGSRPDSGGHSTGYFLLAMIGVAAAVCARSWWRLRVAIQPGWRRVVARRRW